MESECIISHHLGPQSNSKVEKKQSINIRSTRPWDEHIRSDYAIAQDRVCPSLCVNETRNNKISDSYFEPTKQSGSESKFEHSLKLNRVGSDDIYYHSHDRCGNIKEVHISLPRLPNLVTNTRKKRDIVSITSGSQSHPKAKKMVCLRQNPSTKGNKSIVSSDSISDLTSGGREIAEINCIKLGEQGSKKLQKNEQYKDRPGNPMAAVFLFIEDEHKYIGKSERDFYINVKRPCSPMSEITISPVLRETELTYDKSFPPVSIDVIKSVHKENIILPHFSIEDIISEDLEKLK